MGKKLVHINILFLIFICNGKNPNNYLTHDTEYIIIINYATYVSDLCIMAIPVMEFQVRRFKKSKILLSKNQL